MRKSALVVGLWLISCHFSNGQETLSQRSSEQLFQSGLDLLAHQEYGAALKAFESFLQIQRPGDGRQADAEFYKALCALNLYHNDGRKLLEDFITHNPYHPRAVAAYYEFASFFYEEKNYAQASVYFSKVNFQSLSAEQQNTGRFRWGYSLFSQRNQDAALDQFNTIKALGGQYGPAASYYAGFIESSKSDYANALTDLKRAEANPSYATIVPVLIANAYYKLGNDDELISYATTVLGREDAITSEAEVSLLAGEAYFRKKDYQKALPLYQAYLEEHEKNASRGVYYRAGYAAGQVGNEDQALQFLKLSASDVDSVGAYSSYLLGSIYLKRNEKQLALNAFEVSRKFKKEARLAEESLFLSAKINYDLGRPDVAVAELESLLNDFPQSLHVTEVKELLSQAYVNANNYNKAILYIEALPRRSPSIDKAYQKATYLKGAELFNKEEYAQAVSYFEKSLQFPLDPIYVLEASYWSAETYSIGRKYELAIPLYERALGQAASKSNWIKLVRYGQGYAFYNLQQYARATVSFREFVSKSVPADENHADGVLRLADCFYVSKSYAEALAHYRKVIQLNSMDADYAHLQAGIILSIQKKYGEAVNEFTAVSRMAGSKYLDDAMFQRAQIEIEQGDYTAAVTHFSALIAASKSSRILPYAHTRRAAAYYNLKKYNETSDDYIAVLETFPTHPVAQDLLLPLQESLNLANRSAEFDRYLAQFKQSNPDAKGIETVEFETAKNLYFSQNYTKAIDNLSRYVISYPESPRISEARYYEAESYYRLKDLPKSLDLFRKVADDTNFPMLSRVIARMAELEFKQGKYEEAIPSFRKLATMATNKKDEHTAWNGLMESYFLLALYDSSDVYARKIIEQGSVNPSAQNKANLYLGKNAMARGDYETAKDEFITTLNSARDEFGAEAKYLLGEIFYLSREHSQCFETLVQLNSDFSAYEEWVGKSFLLLADNYIAQKETFQAKATLKSLIDNFPRADVRDLAKEKLKKIEEAEAKEKSLEKTDSTDNK